MEPGKVKEDVDHMRINLLVYEKMMYLMAEICYKGD